MLLRESQAKLLNGDPKFIYNRIQTYTARAKKLFDTKQTKLADEMDVNDIIKNYPSLRQFIINISKTVAPESLPHCHLYTAILSGLLSHYEIPHTVCIGLKGDNSIFKSNDTLCNHSWVIAGGKVR